MQGKRWGQVLLLCCAVLLAESASAQTQITTAVIQGTVYDESGAVVPGARVTVRNLETNLERTLETGGDGRFVFLQLPSGPYSLRASKPGFATLVLERMALSVGETIPLSLTMKVSPLAEEITVEAPTVDTVKTELSTTLNELSVRNTPVLGRKFEDLFTLTPGVTVVQGPDGDEISFAGQRGIFTNISLDGGDYVNAFFGEQMGGQRPAVDITMEAVKEFQVTATGASAEFGRTASGVVNVITKSGTNEVHGSAFHFQRLEALSARTSTGEPLRDFHREQFGGSIGGPIQPDKVFYFGTFEQILEKLTRPNLSVPIGTPCSVPAPTITADEALIAASADCQRLALINFIQTTRSQAEGSPVEHSIRATSVLGKFDWNLTTDHRLSASYNLTRSRNPNQTFDVATYGNSANGIEGASLIQGLRANVFSTLSPTRFNEAHFTYIRETRPRAAVASNVPADTAMGFVTTFRFGAPFFLQPTIDELFWRTQVRDNFSLIAGKHTIRFGGEWLHSLNDQTFRGFFTTRYIFDSVTGFLRYASPTAPGGFGPTTAAGTGCTTGSFATLSLGETCATYTGGPLLFFLQDGISLGVAGVPPPGKSNIDNEEIALFVQDKWQILPNFTLNYGLRWEAQYMPKTVDPTTTAYAIFLTDPRFPSNGRIPDQTDLWQPRFGFAWDFLNNQKSVLRGSAGIYYARQNMLTQVGSVTTNGLQQRTNFVNTDLIRLFGVPAPVWPNTEPGSLFPCAGNAPFPCFTGVRVFSRDYENPRIYTANASYEQEIYSNWSFYADFTWAKGVHLTRFINVNRADRGMPFDPTLGEVMTATSAGKSLYRGLTVGMRKRFSQGFQMEWNYVLSKDQDDDSNERDPFTDRSSSAVGFTQADYSPSDRDQRHKFNFFTYLEVRGFQINARMQGRTAQPTSATFPPAPGQRNALRKGNEFFSLDWRVSRPFRLGERFSLIPVFEMFNTFNNKNLVNPLIAPALFNFDGFLRQGVGDPRQVQLAVKFEF